MTQSRGRPRGFEPEAALDAALSVFWRRGYEGASISELTAVMGLSKPSLYAAFGDKETLYLRSLEHYLEHRIRQHATLLTTEPNARKAIRRFLDAMVDMLTDLELPGGCFIITGAANCGGASTPESVETALRKALQKGELALRHCLRRAQEAGQALPDIEPNHLAAFFNTCLAGLAVHAKSGAPRAKLQAVVEAAMAVWPETKGRPTRRR
ncbi:TetR family transcriptional regulator [Geothrix limicola]|uniref:TetR family transcriptional regulator n=1 Tax=Geothrix limicola TaxID=2927978 RepID=A0ABQ5Q9W9_9BACT|nr:TetR/AcrR family transcriptional regulator [Geothrix limicola]GLH71619.1 TetR family transcriptional regulator [Geothrix limicola]